jgi:hypothetical protein
MHTFCLTHISVSTNCQMAKRYLFNKWGKTGVLRAAKLPTKPPPPTLLR